MAIPDTQIQVFKGIPWDKSYTDVRLFDSAAARDTYFNSKAVRTFTNFVYQRHDSGTPGKAAHSVKVDCHADQIRTCNYIRFRNQSVSGVTPRWFYGFITGINYINQNACEVIYELDDFQNWFYDGSLLPCSILRQHSTQQEEDTASFKASNASFFTSPEPVNYTDLITLKKTESDYDFHPAIIVVTTPFNISFHDAILKWKPYLYTEDLNSCGIVNGGAHIWQFKANNPSKGQLHPSIVDSARQFLKDVVDQIGLSADDILDVYYSPCTLDEAVAITRQKYHDPLIRSFSDYGSNSKPRNNKLLFYPFRRIDTKVGATGTEQQLRPETYVGDFYHFCRAYPDFSWTVIPEIHGKTTTSATYDGRKFYTFEPESYNLAGTQSLHDTIAAGAKDYLAVATQAAKNGINAIGQLSAGVASGNPIQIGMGALGLVDTAQVALQGPQQIQNQSSPNLQAMIGIERFTQCLKGLSAFDKEKLDNWFDYYGYNYDGAIGIPRLSGRVHWNYCRTSNCAFKGDIPDDAKRSIQSIFNSGARFWHEDPNPSIIINGTTEKPQPQPEPSEELDKIYKPAIGMLSEAFGEKNTDREIYQIHCAVDIANSSAPKIHPIGNGTTFGFNNNDAGYGNVTWMEHKVGNKYVYTGYAHMVKNDLYPQTGVLLSHEDTLGRMGSTGESTGTHVHCVMFSKLDGSKITEWVTPRGYLSENFSIKGTNWMKDAVWESSGTPDFGDPNGSTQIFSNLTPSGYVYYNWYALDSAEQLKTVMQDAGIDVR